MLHQLTNLTYLDMTQCDQDTFTNKGLAHLTQLQYLNILDCTQLSFLALSQSLKTPYIVFN